jgi:hypothetical protein
VADTPFGPGSVALRDIGDFAACSAARAPYTSSMVSAMAVQPQLAGQAQRAERCGG